MPEVRDKVKLDLNKWKLWKNLFQSIENFSKFGFRASRWKKFRQRLRQYNDQKKKDKQYLTKHYIEYFENDWATWTPVKNRGWTQVLHRMVGSSSSTNDKKKNLLNRYVDHTCFRQWSNIFETSRLSIITIEMLKIVIFIKISLTYHGTCIYHIIICQVNEICGFLL